MARKYYVVEDEFGTPESGEVNTLAEAKKELKKCLQYYNNDPPYELVIVEYTEEDVQ